MVSTLADAADMPAGKALAVVDALIATLQAGLAHTPDLRLAGLRIARDRSARRPSPSPAAVVPEPWREHEARRWADIRESFFANYPSVTGPDLARLTGSRAANPSARAHSWTRAGRIFSVRDGSGERFPLFQFKEGQPRPVISSLLAILGGRLSNWEIAIWLTSPNAWAGNWRSPVDLFDDAPDAVLGAARHEVGELVA